MHNVFVEEVQRRNKEFQKRWIREHKIVPIPKLGDEVSFPVACVTGVCFVVADSPWIRRWENENLEWWSSRENKWIRDGADVSIFSGTVTVVEEPKPEPVWKDCNFIEAVEWMKKYPTMPVARWEGSEYCLGGVSNKIRRYSDGVLIYNVAIGKELDFILGKWQIKVS